MTIKTQIIIGLIALACSLSCFSQDISSFPNLEGAQRNKLSDAISGSSSNPFISSNAFSFSISTNTPSVALKVINTIYTNTNQRMTLVCSLVFPSSLTDSARAAIWTTKSGQTNYFSITSVAAGLSGDATNSLTAFVQPLGNYMITNLNAAIPVTVLQDYWNENRE